MPDDKQGRDKQAHDADRRQRERELEEARERSDEPEPIAPDEEFTEMLANHDYPATTVDLIDAFGNREVGDRSDYYTLEELLESDDQETYDSPADVLERIQEHL